MVLPPCLDWKYCSLRWPRQIRSIWPISWRICSRRSWSWRSGVLTGIMYSNYTTTPEKREKNQRTSTPQKLRDFFDLHATIRNTGTVADQNCSVMVTLNDGGGNSVGS